MITSTQNPQFLFVFRVPQYMPARTPEEMQHVLNQWMAWMRTLKAQGVFHGVNRLEQTGQVLRGPGGNNVTDGPFAEAKEIVGGSMTIDAPSIDQAIKLAKGCPALAHGGSVEVRPVLAIPNL